MPELEQALGVAIDAARGRSGGWSLGQLFSELPEDLRRPVDALGLLHLAMNRDDLALTDDSEPYFAVRPDGSKRTFRVPTIAPGTRVEEDDL